MAVAVLLCKDESDADAGQQRGEAAAEGAAQQPPQVAAESTQDARADHVNAPEQERCLAQGARSRHA